MESTEPPRAGQALVAQMQQELATSGHMSDETWRRYMRLADDLDEDELRLVVEMLGRSTPTVPPSAGAAGAAGGADADTGS
jgi:hypothetical protein